MGAVTPGGDSGLGSLIGSNGLPNYASIPSSVSPKQTIWNLPTSLNGLHLWYDTQQTQEPYDPTTESRNRAESNPYQSSRVMSAPEQIMQQIAAMSFNHPGEFLALQRALASGAWGHVNPSGVWDSDTRNALITALVNYAQVTTGVHGEGAGVGVSFKDYLLQVGQTAQSNLAAAGLGGMGSVAKPHLTDPATIMNAAQNAAQAALGHGLSQAQLNKFVAQFQHEQLTSNTDAYTMNLKLPGEAMQFAQGGSNHADYEANQRQTFVDQLVNMFAPSQSQRPNETPTPSV